MTHLNFIRSLMCCMCGTQGMTEAAHVRKGNGGGMARKPDDSHVVPLCTYCHKTQHSAGEVTFWQDKNPNTLAALLWKCSDKTEQMGNAIVSIWRKKGK